VSQYMSQGMKYVSQWSILYSSTGRVRNIVYYYVYYMDLEGNSTKPNQVQCCCSRDQKRRILRMSARLGYSSIMTFCGLILTEGHMFL
jgi:hypothetical protein